MRRLTCLLFASVAIGHAQGPSTSIAPQQPFVERVDVARILIDARVIDDRGRPVLGLEREDFEVKIDGTPARVESLQWIGEEPRETTLPSIDRGGAVIPASVPGRLIVFLVQKSLEPSRAKGLLRWPQVSGPLLANLTADDRVAVLSFDSHLKIWLDFTSDIDRVLTVLARDVMFKRPASIEPSADPSLVARLSQRQGRHTHTIEEALRLLGRALEPLPGSKSVILVGFGFGRLGPDGSFLMPEYDAARDALQAARATLLCLDVTFADVHTLAHGLETVAADTGGMVASLYLNPRQAVERVVHALGGHYVLFAEKPPFESGIHRIDVRLTRAKGTVLARGSYTD
jgi:VWFA-related protein